LLLGKLRGPFTLGLPVCLVALSNASNLLESCVSVGYTPEMKDSGLRIRVEKELRQEFLALCRQQDRPAAQVIREFMRKYLAEHGENLGDANLTLKASKQKRGKK